VIMDSVSQMIVANIYIAKESYVTVAPLLRSLQGQGLYPRAAIVDGHLRVLEALRETWPAIVIQRCLYHIQAQGLSWLRLYPKTLAGIELRRLLRTLSAIRTPSDQQAFVIRFTQWLQTYRAFVRSLPRTSVAFKDLKRTMALILNARDDMFHFLSDPKIPATTNLLESFYSRLKADFRRHRGMSHKHKTSYLRWYCYLHNRKINNT
jgi:transposase-like protein